MIGKMLPQDEDYVTTYYIFFYADSKTELKKIHFNKRTSLQTMQLINFSLLLIVEPCKKSPDLCIKGFMIYYHLWVFKTNHYALTPHTITPLKLNY